LKTRTHFLVAGLTLAVAAGCAQSDATPEPVDTTADVAAINALRDHEAMVVNSGSSAGVAEVYAQNITMMPPGEPAQNGIAALQSWWDGMASQVTLNVRYTSSDVTVAGDWAFDRYTGEVTITPKAGGAPTTEVIKGVHVLQKGADGWRIVQDVWNSDTAPPAAPAAPSGD
jgi:ketosteroid isomerase-like protein